MSQTKHKQYYLDFCEIFFLHKSEAKASKNAPKKHFLKIQPESVSYIELCTELLYS